MRNPTCGAGVARVNQVRRDPKSGHIIPSPWYEGWRPTERRPLRIPRPSAWFWSTLACLAFWLAFAMLVGVGLDIPG